MVTHYFTLQALSRELNALLRGLTIKEVYSQQKDELLITFREGNTDALHTLCISVSPKFNYCYLRANVTRAKKNSVDLFHQIIGVTVENVSIAEYERTLQLTCGNEQRLMIQLYNTAESNVSIIDLHMLVQQAFKNNNSFKGKVFSIEPNLSASRLLGDATIFTAEVFADPSLAISAAVKKNCSLLGAVYTREVLYRSGIDEHTPVKNISTSDLSTIHKHIHELFDEVERPQPAIYSRSNGTRVLSVVPLLHLTEAERTPFDSVNEAIRARVGETFRTRGAASGKHELVELITKELDRFHRTASRIKDDLKNVKRSEEYHRLGLLLMANIHNISKGLSEITLTDNLGDDTPVRIILDPALTPSRNAERYFEKAKKSNIARGESEQRLRETEQRIALLEELLLPLKDCDTQDQLKEFKQQYERELTTMNLMPAKPNEEQIPFRVFEVTGGFQVWVGKSSANNDLLTMKYAKPNDLWFHVRGAGGSHTVMKVHGTGDPPPKEAIRQAASIAAYYSKMRKAGNVPVAYCERKYVRKPKGLAEGAVMLEREKVIFVQPKLPETLK